MKLTTKHLRQLIREELNNTLNEMREISDGEKIYGLMLSDKESFLQGIEMFNNIKDLGILDAEMEDKIQNAINYYNAINEYLSLNAEFRSIRNAKRAKNADVITHRDKVAHDRMIRMINKYTGVYF